MRAVKGNLSRSPEERCGGIGRPSLGLMARPGKSIAKQSAGRVAGKYLPVGGRVKRSCAVRDQSGHISTGDQTQTIY